MEGDVSNALSALKSDPESREALAELKRTADKLGQAKGWEEAVKLYETALKSAKRGAGENDLLAAMGELLWKRLDDMVRAEAVFRRLRKHDANSEAALAFYRAYHKDRDELPALLNVLTQAQRNADSEEKKTQLGIEMAELASLRPALYEKAIDLWKGVLRRQPGQASAAAALRKLYTETEKWNALTELLKEQLDALSDDWIDDKIAVYLEMIPIYRDKMHLEVMVTNYYTAILKLRPDHAVALAALSEWYEKKARFADLVQVLNKRAEIATDLQEKIDLYRRVAALWGERLGKPQNAATALEHVLALKADDRETVQTLVDLYGKGRRWRELLEVYIRQPADPDPARERERLAAMAALAAERLNDHKQAVAFWNRVLVVAPGDAEALQALAGLHERDKDFAALAEVIAAQADVASEAAAQAALLEKRAVLLHEKLDRSKDALADLNRVHALQPENQRVFRLLRDIHGKLGQHDELEALYAERGAWAELCEVFGELAERAGEDKSAVVLLERVAAIAILRLAEPERAIKAFERLVALDPGHKQANAALSDLYRDTAKWSRLLESYEARLGGAVGDPAAGEAADEKPGKRKKKAAGFSAEEQLAIMAEARKLCEEKLGSKALAFKWCVRSFALAPSDPALFADLERLGEAAEEWGALADIYTRKLKQVQVADGKSADAAAETITLLRKALRIAAGKAKRPAEARRLADELLAVSPGDPEAEAALQQILMTEEKWPEVIELMKKREKRIGVTAERVEILLAAARLSEEKLSQADNAVAMLWQVVELAPDNVRALATLARIAEQRSDWKVLADVLGRQAAQAALPGDGQDKGEADATVALWLRLARLQQNELKDEGAARNAYLRILDIDPMSAEAIEGLERALFDGDMARAEVGPVAQRLASYYESTERYDKWADALEASASAAADDGERLAQLEILTDLYEGPVGNRVDAYGAAFRIFQIDPRNAQNRERLIRLATETGKLAELAGGVEDVLSAAQDPLLRADLWAHVADLEEKQPGHEGRAEKAYRHILEIDPLHMSATAALTRILRDAERWQDLREVLEGREQKTVDAKERLSLLTQIAEIDESLLGDREHAVKTLTRQLELQPQSLAIYQALERLLTALGKWTTLAGLLAKEAEIVPASETEAVVMRRLELLIDKLGNYDEALDKLEAVLKDRPGHEAALRMVERLLRKDKAKQRAANILGPIYNKAEHWEGLVEVLQIRRAALKGPKAVAALKKIAEVQETRLADEPSSLVTWQTILDMEPGNAEAMKAIERLISMLERPEDLVQLYLDMAEKKAADDLKGRADLLTRAARLCVSSLGDRPRAAKVWQMVLDLDADNPESGRPAAEALEALYPQIGDYNGLISILKVKLEWETSSGGKAAYFVRMADLQERALSNPEAALAHLREAFELVPDDRKLLERLEPIFEAREEWKSLVDLLVRRMEQAVGQKARAKLRWRVADVLENKLADLDEAIAMVQANLDEAGGEKRALDALDRLYEKKGAHEARLGTLERRLVLTEAPGERVEFLRRTADLLAGPLEQPADALEKWREILLLSPDDVPTMVSIEKVLTGEGELRRRAAETLEPIYEARSDWKALAGTLFILVETEDDQRTRCKRWTEIADLRRDKLGDQAGAFVAYGHAVRDAVAEDSLPALLDTYESIGKILGRGEEVVALYQEIEPDVLREDVKLRLARRVAAEAMRKGDLDGAKERFTSILDQVPEDAEALSGLDRIYREKGDHDHLYELLVRRAELAGQDAAAELALRSEAGAIAAQLGHPEDAIFSYERALELRPLDGATLLALQALYERTERWADLRELLERRLSTVTVQSDLAAIHERMARLEIDELGNRSQAVVHLGQVLKRDPDAAGAITLLESLLEDPETALGAADLLDPLYARRSAWDKLIRVHEVRRQLAEEPSVRALSSRRIARIYEEQVEDLNEAFEWYGRLFTDAPSDKTVQEQLLRLAPKLGKWERLGQVLGEFLNDELSESAEILEVVKLAAWVADEKLGDRDTARKHYRRFMEAQPAVGTAAQLFESALVRWEAWPELRDLLDDQAARAESTALRVGFWKRSARLSEERLQDLDTAASTLRGVLDEQSGDADAASELERILRTQKRWDDVAEHLRTAMDRESAPAARLAISLRLARLQFGELANPEAALEQYGEILAAAPDQPDALAALESMLGGTDKSLRGRAAVVLEPCYRQTESLGRLVDVLQIRLDEQDDPGERVMLLREIASLEERLSRTDRALEARGKAWLEDVGSDEALAALEAAVPAVAAHGRFVQFLLEGAEKADNADWRAVLLGKAAKTLESPLGQRPRAIEIWQQAVDARPDDDDAQKALARLLEAEGRAADLCTALVQHAENTGDGALRATLWKRVAQLNEATLKRADKAIEAWSTVLENDENDGEALDALARLYAAGNRPRDLVEILERKIRAALGNAAVERGLRLAAARLYDEQLQDFAEASAHVRAILDANPSDLEALEILDRMYLREKQYVELLEILDRRAGLASTPADRDSLAFRAAQVVERDLDDTAGAIERYRQLLERTPDHKGSRDVVWALAKKTDDRPAAIAILEPLLRAQKNWGELVDLLELKIAGEDDPAARLAVLIEVARIEEDTRKDLVKAFALWIRAFGEDPNDDQVRTALERVAQARGDHRKLATVYESKLSESYDAELQKDLALRLASLYEQQLREPDKAISSLQKALEAAGDSPDLLARMEALLRQRSHHKELADILSRQADIAESPEQQADFLTALAKVRLENLSERRPAFEALRDALERNPEHGAALQALRALLRHEDLRGEIIDVLEPLAETRGDHGEMVSLYETRAASENDPATAAGWWRRIAEICEGRLADYPRALGAFGKALLGDPENGQLADDLVRVAERLGKPIEGAKLLEGALQKTEGLSSIELAQKAASLYLKAGTPEAVPAAERLFKKILTIDPENQAALEAIEGLFRRRGDREQLARTLEQRAQSELEPSRQAALFGEAALLHEQRGDLKSAIAGWEKAHGADESDRDALSALARLHESEGNFEKLAAVLEDCARVVDDPAEKGALLVRLSEVRQGSLSDPDGAASALREALDIDADNQKAFEALTVIEESRGNWAELEEVLMQRMSRSSGPAQRALLFRLATTAREKLNDDDRAMGYLRQVLDANPNDDEAFAGIERTLSASERWHDLIELLEGKAAAARAAGKVEPERKHRLRVAEIWAEKLDSPDSACAAVEEILKTDAKHLPSLITLGGLYEKSGRLDEAMATLQKASALRPNGRTAADLHYRLGRLLAAQEAAPAQVEAEYLRAIDADRTHGEALRALEQVSRQLKKGDQLLQVLELRERCAESEAERIAVLKELVALSGIGDRPSPGALATLERLIALAPSDNEARETYGQALIQSGRVAEGEAALKALVASLLQSKQQMKAVARIRATLGILAEKRGDAKAALEHLTAAFQVEPSQPRILAALGRLSEQAGDAAKATRYFRALLLQTFDEAEAGIGKADVYFSLGRLHVAAKEIPKARTMFERGLEAAPGRQDIKAALAQLK